MLGLYLAEVPMRDSYQVWSLYPVSRRKREAKRAADGKLNLTICTFTSLTLHLLAESYWVIQ